MRSNCNIPRRLHVRETPSLRPNARVSHNLNSLENAKVVTRPYSDRQRSGDCRFKRIMSCKTSLRFHTSLSRVKRFFSTDMNHTKYSLSISKWFYCGSTSKPLGRILLRSQWECAQSLVMASAEINMSLYPSHHFNVVRLETVANALHRLS